MVRLTGFEPVTYGLEVRPPYQAVCRSFDFHFFKFYSNATQNATHNPKGPTAETVSPVIYGGPNRIRTCDLPVMSRGLYQLSYRPGKFILR